MSASNISPTHNQDAEKAVLGTILKFGEVMEEVFELLPHQECFYNPKHKRIYEAILSLFEREVPIDTISVTSKLATCNNLSSSGGRAYLIDCCEEVATTANLTSHCEIIKERYGKRQLLKIAQFIQSQINTGEQDNEDIISNAELSMAKLNDINANQPIRLSEAIMPHVDSLLSTDRQQFLDQRIETRIPDLDKITTGFYRGDLCLIASPPSMGKTSIALDVCLFNLEKGKKTLYFSLDQTAQSIESRLITSMTGISKSRLISGALSEIEQSKIRKAATELQSCDDLFIEDKPGLTVTQIRSIARRIKRKHGLDIIVIDYLQQIKSQKKYDNRNLEIAEISLTLKALAKDLNIVMIGLSQLNRTYNQTKISPEKREWGVPNMTMLRDSGALEQDANVIIFLWIPLQLLKMKFGEESNEYKSLLRKNPEIITEAHLIVAKNKDGETGTVKCYRDVERMRFYSLETDSQNIDYANFL